MTADDSIPFESTERHYAEHRPGYDEAALAYLADRFELGDSSRVLDLGCGAGQIAVPLAEHAGEVVAMDPNETMLRHVRRRAERAGRENVDCVVGSDTDLGEELGTFRLTTMGRSFHWMDGKPTLETLYRLTESGGGVALLTGQEWLTKGTRGWQEEVYEVAGEYASLPERTGPVEEYDDPWDELLAEVGFEDVTVERFAFEREWDADGIVGYLRSLSFCSPDVLGEREAAFTSELTDRLNAMDGEPFTQTGTINVISGRK
ncbi:class I SAM-dependent methyltransferase [Haladaptatus sp. CMAA 1911]|uniref:class I SAM-dependent methyltransferase n=1 Tax=unclassified Haladaptatus TaxID=2622732 RepID=UPI0037546CBD